MKDLIERQAAIDKKVLLEDWTGKEYEAILVEDIKHLPSAQPDVTDTNVGDLISRQAAINALYELYEYMRMIDPTEAADLVRQGVFLAEQKIENLPSAQPERLTDDDFETIRIHLNAYKEKLCNQHRWKEAEEYQRIIDRFMAFASAQQERKTGEWDFIGNQMFECTNCEVVYTQNEFKHMRPSVAYPEFPNFCPNCGARMESKA